MDNIPDLKTGKEAADYIANLLKTNSRIKETGVSVDFAYHGNNRLLVSCESKVVVIFSLHKQSNNMVVFSSHLQELFSETNAKLMVFYSNDDNKYRICHTKSEIEDWRTMSVVEFDDVVSEILPLFKENNKTEGETGLQNLKFYEKQEKLLDPEWCREKLGVYADKTICRYSSLESLFCSLKHKTIRMNGVSGMNDKNEGIFAWKLIEKENSDSDQWLRDRKKLMNDTFIVSYSTEKLKDNLNQWRLYGDNAQGVCCVYSVVKKDNLDRFFLHEMKYIDEYNYDKSKDDLLQLFENYAIAGNLRCYEVSPAIFFYKSSVFDGEKEVRLLVDNKETTAYKSERYNREWLLTNSNNIPNPYIDVPFDDLPIKLTEIYLGPNMNDAQTIQIQLKTMLEQHGMKDVNVCLSSITTYRNPNK